MLVKSYVAVIVQLIIWSGFNLALWLSGRDHIMAKVIIFFVFLYLAILVAKKIVLSARVTTWITIISLSCYAVLENVLDLFFITH